MIHSSRREFMVNTALGLGGVALAAQAPRRLKADPFGIPVGLQLYTVRAELAKDPAGTLKKVAAVGYKLVEVTMPAARIRQSIADAGLQAVSGHYSAAELRKGSQAKVDESKGFGLSYLVCSFPTTKDPADMAKLTVNGFKLDDFKFMADLLNTVGEQCHKAGIQLCYHGHNIEFREYDGQTGYDILLERADPNLVKMELDCYWMTRAGHDPVTYFAKYPGRFPLLHIKDMKAGYPPTTDLKEGGNAFTEVGRGSIDWKRIFEHAPQGGLKYYFVEQDVCNDPPFECIRISYDYLHQLQVQA